jgi:hypothetical protein
LYEDTDNGTNYVSIIAPSAVTSNRTITLPDATGTLVTNSGSEAGAFSTLTVNSNNISAENSLGFRNRIINGDMRIDQRNAGASVTVNSTSVFRSVDRWWGTATGSAGVYTMQQSTSSPPTGFTNFLRMTVTTADASIASSDTYYIGSAIEGFNVADLGFGAAGAKTITLSFQVRSSLTGTFSGSILNGSENYSYPFTFSISSANTWESKTVTISGATAGTWATNNTAGMLLTFDLGNGSNWRATAGSWVAAGEYGATGAVTLISTLSATFDITGVQLEVGSVATPFERRDYGRELIMCQRYYQQVGQSNNTAFQPYANGFVSSSTRASIIYNFPVTMRSAPTFTFNGATNTYLSAAVSVTAVNIDIASVYNVMYNADVASGLTTGNATRHYQNSTNASSITLSSEL